MSFLTEYDDLLCGRVKFLILAVYALLQLKHHRAGGVNQGYSVFMCGLVG